MPVLIHELITVELWRDKVFPQLFKIDFEPKNTFVMYLIVSFDFVVYPSIFKVIFECSILSKKKLYHEATLVNLLETVLYHQDVCQSLEDSIFDLVDYCHRKMTEHISM